tara:strand:- start:1817 stop:2530 length:714 start_codon:yes stop_codon:yes gene_type:complete
VPSEGGRSNLIKTSFSTEYINLVAYKQALNPIAEKLREKTNVHTSHLFTMPTTFITKQEVLNHPNPKFDYLLKLYEYDVYPTLDIPEEFDIEANPQQVLDYPETKDALEDFITALLSKGWLVQQQYELKKEVRYSVFEKQLIKDWKRSLGCLQRFRNLYDWDNEYAVLPLLNFATNKPLLIDTKDEEEASSFCEDRNKIMDYIDNLNWSPIVKSSEVYVQHARVFVICKNLRVKEGS